MLGYISVPPPPPEFRTTITVFRSLFNNQSLICPACNTALTYALALRIIIVHLTLVANSPTATCSYTTVASCRQFRAGDKGNSH